MSRYDCSECGQNIDGDPYWYRPCVRGQNPEGTLNLGGRIARGPEPPAALAAGALPFHPDCLEKRLFPD
jgi:hypothetical protein